MATYKTKAIVLSSYPYREHDRIISFYSEEYGRMDARARGTRKIISKLAGHLEPFIETELLLARGRRWDILAGSRTINDGDRIRRSVERRATASVCVEAVKIITKPLARDERVYALLKNTLQWLEEGERTLVEQNTCAHAFLWSLLHLSGFAPEMENCINCRQTAKGAYFSLEGGGILCENCRDRDITAVNIDTGEFKKNRVGEPLSGSVQEIVISFWGQVVDHAELRSWEFFKNVVQ